MYRVKYTLNLLPAVMPKIKEGERDDSLIELLAQAEDTDIFETKVVRDLIHYHWDNYALHVHSFGALMHMLYVINFFVYVSFVY